MTAETQHRNNKKKVARREKRFIARATEASEKIHRAVAGFPLDVLEQIDQLNRPVARIRKLQERSITATYDTVRGVTKELSLLVRGSSKPSRARRPTRAKTRQVRRSQPVERAPKPVRPAAAVG
jgi:hypothetical protein